jgi:hypothetical protein
MTRPPGPIDRGHVTDQIDKGTLARLRSPLPGPLGRGLGAITTEARVAITLRYAVDLLPVELRDQGRALLTPETAAVMAVMLAVSVGAQFTPWGWAVDLVMFCLGTAALGAAFIGVSADLSAFASETVSAETDDDLRRAARHLARAISVIGVGTLLMWLTKQGANIALSTSELLAVARGVILDVADREVALWSGVEPKQIPRQFATLERMLDETPAGRELRLRLSDFQKFKDVWYELSERTATLAAKSKKPVHYFISADRGYYDALYPGKPALHEWWNAYRPELLRGTRNRLTASGTAQADVERQVVAQQQRLSKWTQEDIEAQYYAQHRRSRYDPSRIEDEVFQKLEKLQLRGAWVHEMDPNGIETRKWWQEF